MRGALREPATAARAAVFASLFCFKNLLVQRFLDEGKKAAARASETLPGAKNRAPDSRMRDKGITFFSNIQSFYIKNFISLHKKYIYSQICWVCNFFCFSDVIHIHYLFWQTKINISYFFTIICTIFESECPSFNF